MNTRTAPQLISLFCAAFVTLVMLAGVHTLARPDAAPAQWAGSPTAPRA